MKEHKEAISVIKKFTRICKEDPTFEGKFMIFFEDLILDYKNKLIDAKTMDTKLDDYLTNYQKQKRNKVLESILRKKK